ncbi:ryncolin-4-like [Clytia hemisphaerica]|uniref:ryncolin-4-like n=1 Tax=Clytia hemisphaerica TaxID=252671 RepID=UPI0034D5471F
MVAILQIASCLLMTSMVTASLRCPGVCNRGGVSKREGYCSSLPSNTCGDHCRCSDDPFIQDGYYCDCRGCELSPVVLKTGCQDLFNAGFTASGIYRIAPGGVIMDVYCDMNSTYPSSNWRRGGWVVIQKRIDGSTNFYRNWENYKNGFGYLQNEHWLGNDQIHALTGNGANELWIEMTNYEGITKYARFTSFSVGNEASKYQLSASGYSGDAGNSLANTIHNGRRFTTFDQDNDAWSRNCAKQYLGAWWYGACHNSNLNGKYYFGGSNPYAKGIHWHAFTGHHDSLKTVTMKIR